MDIGLSYMKKFSLQVSYSRGRIEAGHPVKVGIGEPIGRMSSSGGVM